MPTPDKDLGRKMAKFPLPPGMAVWVSAMGVQGFGGKHSVEACLRCSVAADERHVGAADDGSLPDAKIAGRGTSVDSRSVGAVRESSEAAWKC